MKLSIRNAVFAALAMVALLITIMPNSQPAHAQAFSGALFTVSPAAGSTFDTAALPVGTFSVEGSFVGQPHKAKTITGDVVTVQATGKFYRTGTKFASGAVQVHDSYVSNDLNGAIFATGMLVPPLIDNGDGENLTAVTGGIGTYKGAAGELTILSNGDGSFRAEWEPGTLR